MFYGGVQVAGLNLRSPRSRRLQQIGKNAVDLRDLVFYLFHHSTRGTSGRQIAADNFTDTGDSCQRITNFVRQPGCHLPYGGQMFRARHLSAMQAIDLLSVSPQLLDHAIEVPPQVADLVIATREAYG